ncbi:Glycine--tRNA ligase [Galdieria sulphuraria]|nr:Glycine--tRNA ligase [Galdieria sulphuraria]
MSTNKESSVDQLTSALLEQDERVRNMRLQNCQHEELDLEEERLKELHRKLNQLLKETGAASVDDSEMQTNFPREALEGLLKRRFFIAPSFEIYGGVAGLYDYGPPGTAVKNNIIQLWRQHFVVEENMLELEGSCLTPDIVLRASGHVDKFSDMLVKDIETGDCFRADHLLKEQLNKLLQDSNLSVEKRELAETTLTTIDEIDLDEMAKQLKHWKVCSPETGNRLSDPYPFNLMFQTSIGPTGLLPGFLRPETAQGIFVNFRRLLDYQGDKLPFACAQIGTAFRNEIAPRSGLLRVREFTQAEIEHFVHPERKEHPKIEKVCQVKVRLFPRRSQLTTRQAVSMTIREALEQRIIDNETLGYFIARTQLFALKIGLDIHKIRFRQHLQHEMAHYAKDCWDLEVESSYGWIECAGLADRACYDLQNHSEKSHVDLTAFEVFPEKKQMEVWVAEFNKGVLGKTFRHEAAPIMKTIDALSEVEKQNLQRCLEKEGSISVSVQDKQYNLTKDMVCFKKVTKSLSGQSYYPSVIEPSFGIGRLLYCVWEHNFYIRSGDDEQRAVLSLPAMVAPYKCTVLPLSKNVVFQTLITQVGEKLTRLGIQHKVDESGVSIGKRYARADELGIPLAITIDFDSLQDGSVTLRERDSTKQVRGSVDEIIQEVNLLSDGKAEWKDVMQRHPIFEANST